MRYKFNAMSKAWLKWGLVYPVGSTFRVGLATIVVASSSIDNFAHLHLNQLYHEFVAEFRSLRSISHGAATFQDFPAQADALSRCIQASLSVSSLVGWV